MWGWRRWLIAAMGVGLVAGLLVVGPTSASADPVWTWSPAQERLADAAVGMPYSQTIAAGSPDAVAPVTYAASGRDTESMEQTGISLSPDGVLHGTPTATGGFDGVGTFHTVITATDAHGATSSHEYWFAVYDPVAIDTKATDLPAGAVGTPFPATQLVSQGGSSDPTWSVTAGALPAGLEVSTHGVITGTPTAAGTSAFTVTVTDAFGRTATHEFSITVYLPLVVTTTVLLDAALQVDYSAPILATGASGTTYWTYESGTLPPGIGVRGVDQGEVWGRPTQPGTYTFTVRVHEITPARTADRTLTLTVLPAVVPQQPSISSVNGNDRYIVVQWNRPFDGGAPITSWIVTPYLDGIAQAPVTADGATSGVKVTDVDLLREYTFTVAAVNAAGTGPTSPMSASALAYAAAGPPTGVTATGGPARAVVRWVAPADPGTQEIVRYQVNVYVDDVLVDGRSASATARSLSVTGLTNGTNYRFTVWAHTGIEGHESDPTDPVTPSDRPQPPRLTTLTAGNGTVALAWSAPPSPGISPITSYVLTPVVAGVDQPTIPLATTGTSTTVTGLSNGTTYAFRLAAVNGSGAGLASPLSATVTVGTPSKPGFQSAQPGNGSAKVGWAAPTDNGAPVTGYVVTPFLGTIAQPSQTFPTAATTDVVTGLASGSTYTFRIAATNARGTGPLSTPTNEVVVGAPNAPGFPNPVPEVTSVRISWLASTANGAPIQGYDITPYLGSAAQPKVRFASTATKQTIMGLTSGATYTFRIAGYNAIGASPPATTTAVVVGTPAPPGFQSAASLTDSARVQFTTPAANTAPITGYAVWPVRNGTVLAPITYPAPAATSLTIPSLPVGGSYAFRIAATSSIGTGPYALTNTVVIGTPAAPAFPSAQPGDGVARVAWSAAADNGSAITGYVMTPYVGTAAQAPRSFPAGSTSVTVTGLTNGTTYTFKVSAVNARGTGLASTTPTAIMVGTPGSPAFPSATGGNGQATVRAAAPSGNGSPVTSYVVTPMVGTTAKPSRTFPATSTTWIVTGLTNGTTYTFKVSAVNARGAGPAGTTRAVTPS